MFVTLSVLDREITIHGDGKQVRDILYIDDLVKAFEMAVDRIKKTREEVYNMGVRENTTSLLELLDTLERLLGKNIKYSSDDWRPRDQKIYYTNLGKAEREFGWKPAVTKEEGIKRLLNWVLENRQLFK